MRLALTMTGARSGVAAEPLLIAAFCLLWSAAFAVSKIALADCPPLLLLTIRFLVAGAITLAGAAAFQVNWRLAWRDALVLAAIGIANNALYLGFNYSGMRTVSPGPAALSPHPKTGFHSHPFALFLRLARSAAQSVVAR